METKPTFFPQETKILKSHWLQKIVCVCVSIYFYFLKAYHIFLRVSEKQRIFHALDLFIPYLIQALMHVFEFVNAHPYENHYFVHKCMKGKHILATVEKKVAT